MTTTNAELKLQYEQRARDAHKAGFRCHITPGMPWVDLTHTNDMEWSYHFNAQEADELLATVPDWIDPESYLLATSQDW